MAKGESEFLNPDIHVAVEDHVVQDIVMRRTRS
jgi:hypothetical protein